MFKLLKVIIALFTFTTFVNAQDVLEIQSNERSIPISINYDGNNVNVYGTTNLKGNIIIFIKGNQEQYTVTKKVQNDMFWSEEKIANITIPSFYIMSSEKLILEDQQKKIGFGIKSIIPNITTFGDYSEDKIWDNIIKIKIKKKLYSYNTNSIKRKGQLFKATFKLPSNTAIGGYFVKAVVLKQNGEISNYATDYFVTERYGVINTIYSTARDYPHIYAIIVILLSLLIGLIAGYRKN